MANKGEAKQAVVESIARIETSASVERERDGSSSLTKMLSILDLFSLEEPVWSTGDLLSALQVSRSTGYRYIKALTAAGLLGAVGNGYYMLGSRIIELDLQIRLTDPLLRAGDGVLEELVSATGHSALLCMLFQNSVLCISEQRARLSPAFLFRRGQRRPLFRGAISKVILAHLPSHRLRNIYSRRQIVIAEAALGADWDSFRDGMAKIRTDGYAKSIGEFIPGVLGIAAPIFNVDAAIIGAVGIACDKDELPDIDLTRVIVLVKRAAREITSRMSTIDSGLGLPPRAVG